MNSNFPLKVSPAVAQALAAHKPVLALESTVITHGLPYPQNFAILTALEAIADQHHVVPATICVLDGECLIGMQSSDIENLKSKILQGEELQKLAWRDLPLAIVRKASGGTTVSATMALAHKAGIKVFATGGIGGVHRAWQKTLDISLDIKSLAEIPLIVVCAGCKAILDIGATLEALETANVPVYGWQCQDFPSFYSRNSGYKIPEISKLSEIAEVYRLMSENAEQAPALLIANPIPEADEILYSDIEPHIRQALKDAQALSGKAVTPYLLDKLAQSTAGKSVTANLALLKNNVRLGALIAGERL
ncbi:MAG: pseudouridylate synthase [Candidatus Cloacimonadota bacterium]|nr:pseudouridylate synthase [Candidatus Cloacimonadota bacterium]